MPRITTTTPATLLDDDEPAGLIPKAPHFAVARGENRPSCGGETGSRHWLWHRLTETVLAARHWLWAGRRVTAPPAMIFEMLEALPPEETTPPPKRPARTRRPAAVKPTAATASPQAKPGPRQRVRKSRPPALVPPSAPRGGRS